MDEITTYEEIEKFEQNIDRLGIAQKSQIAASEKQRFSGTPTETMMNLSKIVEDQSKKSKGESRSFLKTLKAKEVDTSQARIEREKRIAKQASDEKHSEESTRTAAIGEAFLNEIMMFILKRNQLNERQKALIAEKEKKKEQRYQEQQREKERLDSEYERYMKDFLYPSIKIQKQTEKEQPQNDEGLNEESTEKNEMDGELKNDPNGSEVEKER